MVICVEVTDDSHPPSRRMQPHIVNLAREIQQIPFFRAKIGLGRTYDEVLESEREGGSGKVDRVYY